MIPLGQHVNESVRYITARIGGPPEIAVILGSGLGDFAETLPNRIALANADIPHYPRSTVEGHKGRLVFASLNDRPILAYQGRVHYYESGTLETVLYPIRVAHALGVTTLIMTNAAGGVGRHLEVGDLMLVTDQIDLTMELHITSGGRGPARELYSKELNVRAIEVAASGGITLKRGVYAGVKGPSYETAAEVETVHRIGGDAVGMSTVAEVALAASLGLRVIGISCITNRATGIHMEKLDHGDVTEVANRVKHKFESLLRALIATL
jgi:purine-nucleoside phosphorylase